MPSLRHFFSQQLKTAVTALLPSSCALCGAAGDALLCPGCQHQFFRQAGGGRCSQCALPLPPNEAQGKCGECLSLKPSFDCSIVASNYTAPIDQLVLALKFGHRLPLANLFAELLRDAILQAAQHNFPDQMPDMLCPVPLGPQRLRERGFNQSLEIAKPLCAHLGIRLQADLVCRSRETAQQSGLHPDDRHKNIRNAFCAGAGAIDLIRGKHIALVDDVMTTGTTLNEIAALLKRFGASKVSNYVFARTPRH